MDQVGSSWSDYLSKFAELEELLKFWEDDDVSGIDFSDVDEVAFPNIHTDVHKEQVISNISAERQDSSEGASISENQRDSVWNAEISRENAVSVLTLHQDSVPQRYQPKLLLHNSDGATEPTTFQREQFDDVDQGFVQSTGQDRRAEPFVSHFSAAQHGTESEVSTTVNHSDSISDAEIPEPRAVPPLRPHQESPNHSFLPNRSQPILEVDTSDCVIQPIVFGPTGQETPPCEEHLNGDFFQMQSQGNGSLDTAEFLSSASVVTCETVNTERISQSTYEDIGVTSPALALPTGMTLDSAAGGPVVAYMMNAEGTALFPVFQAFENSDTRKITQDDIPQETGVQNNVFDSYSAFPLDCDQPNQEQISEGRFNQLSLPISSVTGPAHTEQEVSKKQRKRKRSENPFHKADDEGTRKRRRFRCYNQDCDLVFPSKWDLDRHFRTHSGDRPFFCEVCSRTFNRKDKLKEHFRTKFHIRNEEKSLLNLAVQSSSPFIDQQ